MLRRTLLPALLAAWAGTAAPPFLPGAGPTPPPTAPDSAHPGRKPITDSAAARAATAAAAKAPAVAADSLARRRRPPCPPIRSAGPPSIPCARGRPIPRGPIPRARAIPPRGPPRGRISPGSRRMRATPAAPPRGRFPAGAARAISPTRRSDGRGRGPGPCRSPIGGPCRRPRPTSSSGRIRRIFRAACRPPTASRCTARAAMPTASRRRGGRSRPWIRR
jgi:hypothetical protein